MAGNTNAPVFIRNVTGSTVAGNSLLAHAPSAGSVVGGTDIDLSSAVSATGNDAVSKAALEAELQVTIP